MDVLVERFQRRKDVTDPNSQKLYYLRQKPKTCGKVDIDVLAASIQKNCAMTKGDVKHVIEAPCGRNPDEPCQRRQGEAEPARHASHDVSLSGCGEVGRLHGEEYLQSEYPLCARQGAEACERQYGCHPQSGKCVFCAGQACGRQFFRWQQRR